MEKPVAIIKHAPEEFIVEEITAEGDVCKTSKEFNSGVDISGLDQEISKEFLWCDLEKKDIDQFRTLRELSSGIHKGIDAIGFAGTKDKKAWTCQRISIFRPDLEAIKIFNHPNISLKNFKWNKRKIKMGYLKGNRFKITLRNIDKKSAIKISSVLRKLDSFENYFGMQRFGSVRGNNAKIGYLIVKRKFKEAVDKILLETGGKEQEEVKAARERLAKEKDYKKALDYFPIYLGLERKILSYLSENPEDYVGLINKVDRKQFLMFVHSLQSEIFNEILETAMSERFNFNQQGQKKIPLFGYKSKIDDGRLGEIEKEILSAHNLEPEDFDVKEIPYLRIKGDLRDALVPVDVLNLEVEEDELNEDAKKMMIEFNLPKGVYATTFLENFFELRED